MPFRCVLCHPTVVNCRNIAHMKSHLGAKDIPAHNMGPYRCQFAGCAKRCNRGRAQVHGNHQARWAKDQALEDALDELADDCQLPWAAGVFPGAVPRPAAAVQAPPAAPANPPADVETFALDVEWMQWRREKEEDEEEPIPGYYHHFGIPYGTGPPIPGGRQAPR